MSLDGFKSHVMKEIDILYKQSEKNNFVAKSSEEFNRFVFLNEILDELELYEKNEVK